MKKKASRKYSYEQSFTAFGFLLAGLGILILLSPSTHLKFFAYGLDFLFGLVGFYGLSAAMVGIGLCIPFRKKMKKGKLRLFIAFLLCLLGMSVLFNAVFASGNALEQQETLRLALQEDVQLPGALGSDLRLAGGYVGASICGAFNGLAGVWLSYLLSIFVLFAAFVVLFFPMLADIAHALSAKAAISRSRRAEERKRRKEGLYSVKLGESDEPEAEETPVEESRLSRPSGLDEYSFTPSSSLPYASRAEYREAETEKKSEPTSAPRRAQVVLGNADPQYYQSNLTAPGPTPLREATFQLDGEETPTPVAPAPMKEAIPEEFAPKAPEPETVPEPVKEEEPSSLALREDSPLAELLKENEKEEEPVSVDIAEEEPLEVALAPEEAPVEEEVRSREVEPEPEPSPAPEPIKEKKKTPLDLMPDEKPLPGYQFPGLNLLKDWPDDGRNEEMRADCERKALVINRIFEDLGVGAHVAGYSIGPSVTRFDIQTDPSVTISAVERIKKDISQRLDGTPCRFVGVVLGKSTSALEIANATTTIVSFKETVSALPKADQASLMIPFGKDIEQRIVRGDLSEFPHMLVAGTTGSGKSIFIHGILMSLIMRNRPEEVKLLLIDPKRVEFAKYKAIPHLLCPIVKEANQAKVALKKLVDLMDERFAVLEEAGARDIGEFNQDFAHELHKAKMPYIVVVVDEFADLVNQEKEISEHVLRLAQKARAAGIHMIIATQRPDTKVITGTIKSNLPCRVALSVNTGIDSQVILDQYGAEELAGHGDMLVSCERVQKRGLARAQGCLVDGKEILNVCSFIANQMKQDFDPRFLDLEEHDEGSLGGDIPAAAPSAAESKGLSDEERYLQIKRAIYAEEYTSISKIQRQFGVGFPRAGRIFARLQAEGVVAKQSDAPNSSHGCKVLVHSEEDDPSLHGGL